LKKLSGAMPLSSAPLAEPLTLTFEKLALPRLALLQ